MHVLQNTAIQVGFMLGPVAGNALFQWLGFAGFSAITGGLQILFGVCWLHSSAGSSG